MSKLAAFEQALEAQGGDDAFFDRLASTEDLEDIARFYGASLRTIDLWRKATDERRADWDEAMSVSAHAYAAEGKKILDDLHKRATVNRAERLESAHVALATARSTSRMKLAAARNPQAYGDRPQVTVNNTVNLGGLHLDALKARGSMNRLESPVSPAGLLASPDSGEIVVNPPESTEAA